jgi:fructose-specific phosphotransferase system IIA component
MDIEKLTNKNLINLEFDAKDSREAIIRLSDMLEHEGKLSSKELFIMDVINREKESSTGFGRGFALPHGKSQAVIEPCFAIGRSRRGVSWESFDKKPVNFIILLAVPDEESGTRHLDILSQISRKLISEEYRERLMAAKDREEILSMLSSQAD